MDWLKDIMLISPTKTKALLINKSFFKVIMNCSFYVSSTIYSLTLAEDDIWYMKVAYIVLITLSIYHLYIKIIHEWVDDIFTIVIQSHSLLSYVIISNFVFAALLKISFYSGSTRKVDICGL